MNTGFDDYKEIIQTNYEKMTKTEQYIADYFLQDNLTEDLSAEAVTKRLFVSKATLTRFARRCGCEGYREFIFRYKSKSGEAETSFTKITNEVISTYQILYNRTLQLINEEQLKRIVQMFLDSDRIYFFGNGSSGYTAQDFALRFLRLGLPVQAITDSLLIQANSSLMQPNSVVVGLSVGAKTKVIVESMKFAREQGAKTILITANRSSKLVLLFDEVINIAHDKMLDSGISISPQFPLLIMCDIIFSYYLNTDVFLRKSNYKRTLDVLKAIEK